jgi:hypothetical protein
MMYSEVSSAFCGAASSSITQSLGTLSLPILGSCGATDVFNVGAAAFAGVGDAGGCVFGVPNRPPPLLEEPERLAKGLDGSFARGC